MQICLNIQKAAMRGLIYKDIQPDAFALNLEINLEPAPGSQSGDWEHISYTLDW